MIVRMRADGSAAGRPMGLQRRMPMSQRQHREEDLCDDVETERGGGKWSMATSHRDAQETKMESRGEYRADENASSLTCYGGEGDLVRSGKGRRHENLFPNRSAGRAPAL